MYTTERANLKQITEFNNILMAVAFRNWNMNTLIDKEEKGKTHIHIYGQNSKCDIP